MVGVGGAMKLDECLGRKKGVVAGDGEGKGLLMEEVCFCGKCAACGNAEGEFWMVCSF